MSSEVPQPTPTWRVSPFEGQRLSRQVHITAHFREQPGYGGGGEQLAPLGGVGVQGGGWRSAEYISQSQVQGGGGPTGKQRESHINQSPTPHDSNMLQDLKRWQFSVGKQLLVTWNRQTTPPLLFGETATLSHC